MPMNDLNIPGGRWEPELGIIFSLRDDFVWATWPETEAAVRLGRHHIVASMMRDFLAQDALGERLAIRRPPSG
jgi:uncharacterized protein (DUF2237 family)